MNWFKKKKQAKVIIVEDNKSNVGLATVLATTKSYPKEVLEIHNEFNTAADKLIKEANGILKEAQSKGTTKVQRLEALGFRQSNQVTELKPLLQKAELSKEQIELVSYYKKQYPLNKFITEEQVKTICHKYNLICGEVDRYKGFVPEKNLKDIEAFKLKEIDETYEYRYYLSDTWMSCTKSQYERGVFNRGYNYDYRQANKVFNICAPVKDMDTSGLEIEDGYKLVKKHIPDPVVLQSVKGGYLIVTAWGDEASDPLVVNEINN